MKAIDLCCCQGGASMGISRAGFDVEGVDIRPQPRYPFPFHHADALDFEIPGGTDFIWASPPCQAYSITRRCHGNKHPDLIPAFREKLVEWGDRTGGYWIMENVVGAPLVNAVQLDGPSFGLNTYRRRRFESNLLLLTPYSRLRRGLCVNGPMVSVAGNGRSSMDTKQAWSDALGGVPWMSKKGMAQAIPPVYAWFLARQVAAALETRLGTSLGAAA